MSNEPLFAYLRSECCVCGKEFYRQCEDWGWTYKGQMCCSYKCMRIREREEEDKIKNKIHKQLEGVPQPDKIRKKIRMPKKEGREITMEQREKALRMLLSTNATYEEIGRQCKMGRTKVGELARGYGIARARGRKVGKKLEKREKVESRK